MLKAVTRHINAATVLALAAMVFAMSGGAYALTGGTAHSADHHAHAGKSAKKKKTKSKASGKRGPRGKQGPKGEAGPAGPQGPQGPQGQAGKDGASGAAGEAGKEGPEGKAGTDGVSVTASEAVGTIEGTHCVGVGGSKFESASGKTYACNGKEGKEGKEGALGTAGTALPVGAMETGSWVGLVPAEVAGPTRFAISFPIPLAKAIATFLNVVVIQPAGTVPSECENEGHSGSASAENPEAASGYLCVFVGLQEGGSPLANVYVSKTGAAQAATGASTSGAMITFRRTTEEEEKLSKSEAVGQAWASGTFAVGG